MKDKHIIDILARGPLSALTRSELEEIQAHAGPCESCGRALAAARVSAAMLQERAREEFEPSPFFQTRVMAALRDRQAANETWAWSRLWRSAGGLASSMLATVAALVVLTFAVPVSQTPDTNSSVMAVNAYSTEAVVLDENAAADDQVSDNEALATLYEADDDLK
jgi:anti-sigma-K factor RskA